MQVRIPDSTDRLILAILTADARVGLREIGARVGLSAPAVRERIRRMEDDGTIRAFTIDLGIQALGYLTEAIVRIQPLPGRLTEVESIVREIPEVTACDIVTGDDCLVVRLALRSLDDLDRLLEPIHRIAATSTGIVKRSPVQRRAPPL